MRKLITFISALLIAATIMGQSPGSFKYQSVLRDARGNLRTNTSVNIKIDILSGNKNGPVVFSETQKVISDGNGIINLNIGSVSSGTAIFAVNWKSGEYFIRVTVDGIDMGTSQLLSVPYALYVYKAGNDFNGSYYDLINKPVLFNGTWSKLTGKPSFAKVATSGKYSDLINKPPKTTGTVTNVTATAPVIVANGSSTPLLSMMPANGSTSGYLSSSDWTMFNNKGTFDGTWMSLSGKPSLAIVATTGSYNDLINKPKGNNSGDMQFWNGSDWDIIPVGQPGQRLQIAQTKIPAWNGSAFLTLTTNPITNLAQTTATSGGSVSVAGGSPVIARGVCWSTSENPTVVNSKTIDGAGIGNFTSSMTGLTAGTTYYVRAYATNSEGTSYGNQLSFTTTASGSGNIRYIRFESYYSGDNEQVNVYEIQAYEGAVNVALNKPGYANSYEGGNWASNGSQAVDGNGNSRWSSNRSDPGPDPANPHFIVIDLQNLTSIDSIILNIKGFDSWLQTFDLSVSADSVNWQSVGSGQNITGIFTYKLNGNNTPVPPTNGLLAYYPFNGNANDESGNGHDGIVNGAVLAPDRFGSGNSAYSFNGTSNYINLGSLGSYSSHTYSGWFKIDGQQINWGVLVSKLYNDLYIFQNSEIRIDPDYGEGYKMSCQVGSGSNWVGPLMNNPIDPSVWHHFVFVYDDNEKTIAVYLDNSLFGKVDVTGYGDVSTTPTYIGARPYWNGPTVFFFNGKIDDVSIYNRALTVSEVGSLYGSFTPQTSTIPVITTSPLSSITPSSAVCGGNITSDGGTTVTARGVCWSTTSNPTISDSKTTDGTATGAFISSLTGLTAETIYYVRAYATNSKGTAYGNEYHFSTLPQSYGIYTVKVGTDELYFVDINTKAMTKVANLGMICDGFTEIEYRNEILYIEKGGYIYTLDMKTGILSQVFTNPNLGLGFSFNSAGEFYTLHELTSTAQGSLYRIDLSTNTGTKIGSTTGSLSILGIDFDNTGQLWAVDEFAQKFGKLSTSTGLISFVSPAFPYSDMLYLSADDNGFLYTYNVGTPKGIVRYDIANNTQSLFLPTTDSYAGLEYAPFAIIPPLPTIPTTVTNAVTLITQSSAVCGGNITNDGGAPLTARGVCWSTSSNPTIADSKTSNGTGTGSFTSSMTSLAAGVSYYVRAYATNSVGTAYGNEISFSTNPVGTIVIGDTYEGGVVAYILQPGDPGYIAGQTSGIIASPVDLSTGIKWSVTSTITGSTGTAVGTGNANTSQIVTDQGAGVYAAWICINLVSGGYSDWYLPSKDELDKLYINRAAIGTFSPGSYWSSSESSSNIAWTENFVTGISSQQVKNNSYNVRAVRSFLTAPQTLPDVITGSALSITQTTVTSGGNVTSDGGQAVTSRGVCWNTSPNPTTSNSKTIDGSGTGSFTSSITGLTASTTYYVRAYAINSAGTAYGNEVSFTTSAASATVMDIDGNIYNTVTIGTQTWMSENLKTTRYSNGTPIDLVNSVSAWDALTTSSKAYCWYNDDINNKNLNGALYTWAAAMNGAGASTSIPSAVQGVCPTGWHLPSWFEWGVLIKYLDPSSNPATWLESSIAGGIMKETGTTHWQSPNTGATNGNGFTALPSGGRGGNGGFLLFGMEGLWWSTTDYGNGFTRVEKVGYNSSSNYMNSTPWDCGISVRCIQGAGLAVPSLAFTTGASSITQTTAASGGNITNDGGANVTARGVCWSTTPNPTVELTTKTTDGTGTGAFTSSITGLTPGTLYYIRAYATNSVGTGYSYSYSDVSFTTETAVPSLSGNIASKTDVLCFGAATGSVTASASGGLIPYEYRLDGGTYQLSGTFGGLMAGAHIVTVRDAALSTFDVNVTITQPAAVLSGSISSQTNVSTFGGNDGLVTILASGGTPPYQYKLGSGVYQSSGTFGTLTAGNYMVTIQDANLCTFNVPVTITQPVQTLATITTIVASSITSTTASSGGNVTSDGGAAVTARGVCWSTTTDPTIANNKTIDGTGTGAFTSSLTGLTGSKTYYVRAYATNSVGTVYGNEVIFVTLCQNCGTVTDVDGNIYNAVAIGDQCWMQENLKTTKYNDGTDIPFITDEAAWAALATPGYSWYNNDATTNKNTYGGLYNWYTVNTGKLCPSGWHVPTDAEYSTLVTNLGGLDVAGGKLKEAGTSHWQTPNTGATNETCFTALPGGVRRNSGAFSEIGTGGKWWSATENNATTSIEYAMVYLFSYVAVPSMMKNDGISVRCIKDSAPTIILPNLSTQNISVITSTSATSGGNITNDGGAAVTARGVCWSTSSNPTITNSKTIDGTGIGSFTSSITGLIAGTTYYVRAYATNSAGTAYGNQVTFTTISTPTVTTTSATIIRAFTATSGGNVTSTGGSSVTARGVCWSINTNPTTADSKTADGSGAGVFTSSIASLSPLTTYYVRAYATNISGTAYGNQISFTTPDLAVGDSYQGGIIAYILQPGDPDYVPGMKGGFIVQDSDLSTGVVWGCWGTDIGGSGAAERTIIGGGDENTLEIISECWETNIAASLCNDLVFNGYTDWYLPSKDELYKLYLNRSVIGGFNSSYYWSSSEAIAVSAWAQNFTNGTYSVLPKTSIFRIRAIRSFSIAPTILSTLSTTAISAITSTSASSGGNVTSDGGAAVTARGVCWSTSANPTIANNKTTDGTGTGVFTSSITGLTAGTTYYVRAYATNIVGTAYGNEVSFTTLSAGPLAVGDPFQGGIIAYILQPGDPGYVAGQTGGIIATPNDVSTYAPWGCNATNISGADGTIIGTGNQNTTDILAGCGTAGIAARLCYDYVWNGYSDWYLPSKDELNMLYNNRAAIGNFSESHYWSSSEYSNLQAWSKDFGHFTVENNSKGNEYHVRAVRSFSIASGTTMTDIDGNVYNTVTIGTQVWMAENLKTTKYRNGDIIGTTSPVTLDITLEPTPKYQWAYDGIESNVATYGRLYTWYAVTDIRNVCPAGWHVPSDPEWTTMENYLIANGYNYDGTTTGNKIAKSLAATTNWTTHTNIGAIGNNLAANNITGFSALPSGFRYYSGGFTGIGTNCYWVSSSAESSYTWDRSMYYHVSWVTANVRDRKEGKSVRCLKD